LLSLYLSGINFSKYASLLLAFPTPVLIPPRDMLSLRATDGGTANDEPSHWEWN
jgi:hypothetical protein